MKQIFHEVIIKTNGSGLYDFTEQTKDFVNINFLDNPRLKKPPGIYWLQAVSVTLTKNILFLDKAPLWAYRLPSAIGASIAVWLTFLIGQLLFGRKQGFIASLLLLSSPLLLMESHIAKTDSVLLAFFLYILYILAKIILGRGLIYQLIYSLYNIIFLPFF